MGEGGKVMIIFRNNIEEGRVDNTTFDLDVENEMNHKAHGLFSHSEATMKNNVKHLRFAYFNAMTKEQIEDVFELVEKDGHNALCDKDGIDQINEICRWNSGCYSVNYDSITIKKFCQSGVCVSKNFYSKKKCATIKFTDFEESDYTHFKEALLEINREVLRRIDSIEKFSSPIPESVDYNHIGIVNKDGLVSIGDKVSLSNQGKSIYSVKIDSSMLIDAIGPYRHSPQPDYVRSFGYLKQDIKEEIERINVDFYAKQEFLIHKLFSKNKYRNIIDFDKLAAYYGFNIY